MTTRLVLHPNAPAMIARLAAPQLERAANAIAKAIPENVPRHHGGIRKTFHPTVRRVGDKFRVFPGSWFWHWLEYGTRWSPPYRPIERAVRALGLRFEAH